MTLRFKNYEQYPTSSQERARERRCRFLSHLFAGEPTALEWLLGTLKIGWGLWLLLPFHAFAASPHLYRYAVAALPEWGWGSVMLALGTAQWACWYFQWQRGRFFASAAAVLFWLRLGGLMWEADHRSASLVIQTVLALGQVLAAMWLFGKAFPSEADKAQGYDQL